MSKRSFVVVAVGVCALVVAGGLFASNMGFKLNYGLDPTGVNGSASGTTSLALPYNQQTSLVNASDLRNDIDLTVPGTFISLTRIVEQSDGTQTYAGPNLPNDFPLVPGEGYVLQTGGAATVNYIIVGSHDPGLVVTLQGVGPASNSGTNLFSYPYHATAATAVALEADIEAAGSDVISISRIVKTNDSVQTYSNPNLPGDFPLAPGESYVIQMASDVAYVPSHY